MRAERNTPAIKNILLIAYRLLLDYSYFRVICKHFLYQGFIDNRTSTSLLISWVMLLVVGIVINPILKRESDKISEMCLCSLFLISYVPFTTCVYAGAVTYSCAFWNTIYWCILIAFVTHWSKKNPKPLPKIKMGNLIVGDKFVLAIGCCSLVLVVYISARYTHFRLNFNMFGVYALRNDVINFNLPTIVSYMFSWSRAINPILLAYCMIKKRLPMAILYFICQMFSFGIDGLKTTFFMPFLTIAVVLFVTPQIMKKMKSYLLLGFNAILAFGFIENLLFKTYFIYELFVRRIMFLTNLINNWYFDFFSKHQPDYFRESLLRFLGVKSPYADSGGVTMTVGETYSKLGTNYNNGLFSDAIANLGIIGVFIMPIVVAYVLHMLDRSIEGLDKRLIIAFALYLTIILLSSFLSTALITHGLLVVLLLMTLMRRSSISDIKV